MQEQDLSKSESESYMCETGLVLSELSYMIKHCRGFSRPRRVRTPLAQSLSRSYRLPSPYGTVLVMNPWNYPFLLSLDPLIDAVAAGNTVVLKTSSYSPNTNQAIRAVLDHVDFGDAVMQEEIFGPLLPILTSRDEAELKEYISSHEAPRLLSRKDRI